MPKNHRTHPARILLVDDSWTIRVFVQQTLVGAGFHVDSSPDLDICDRLRELRPDLVLLDVGLADGVDGSHAVERVRRECAPRPVRIALYSSLPAADLAALAEARQADGVLLKSSDPVTLRRGVGELLATAPSGFLQDVISEDSP